MWGVFTQRKSFSVYEFQVDNKPLQITLKYGTFPILHSVQYFIILDEKHQYKIEDANKIQLNKAIQERYFPDYTFEALLNRPQQIFSEHLDAQRWQNFDIDFHAQRLIPSRPVTEFISYIIEGKFEFLVREFMGVDSSRLHRFTTNTALIREAYLIAEFSERMKIHRRVWLNSEDVSGILLEKDDDWKNTWITLLQAKIFTKKDNKLAFTWAVTQLQKLQELNLTVEHEQDVPSKNHRGPSSLVFVDFELSIDDWLDSKNVPPVVLRINDISRELPPFCLCRCKSDAITIVFNFLGQSPKRTLCISTSGNITFDQKAHDTCIVLLAFLQFKKHDIVLVKPNFLNLSTSIVSLNEHSSVVLNSTLYVHLRSLSSVSFKNLKTIRKDSLFEHVIVLKDKTVPKRWVLEALRFKNTFLIQF
jgi:hypothetical protein